MGYLTTCISLCPQLIHPSTRPTDVNVYWHKLIGSWSLLILIFFRKCQDGIRCRVFIITRLCVDWRRFWISLNHLLLSLCSCPTPFISNSQIKVIFVTMLSIFKLFISSGSILEIGPWGHIFAQQFSMTFFQWNIHFLWEIINTEDFQYGFSLNTFHS